MKISYFRRQTLNLEQVRGIVKLFLTIVMFFISEESAAVIYDTVILYNRKIYCTSEVLLINITYFPKTEP